MIQIQEFYSIQRGVPPKVCLFANSGPPNTKPQIPNPYVIQVMGLWAMRAFAQQCSHRFNYVSTSICADSSGIDPMQSV